MKNKKIYSLFRVIFLFILYVFYSEIFNKIFLLVGLNNTLFSMFISDLFFLILIVLINKNILKEKFEDYKKNYNFKEKILITIKWLLIILFINVFMGIMTEIFFPSLATGNDDNTLTLTKLFDISFLYSLFKTLIFAPIAEELLFKEEIRNIVKNNVVFVLTSSLIYTIMNFIYATNMQFLDLLGYFLFAFILSISYVKNNNIIIIMIIKFVYNLIPTLLLIGAMIAGVNI